MLSSFVTAVWASSTSQTAPHSHPYPWGRCPALQVSSGSCIRHIQPWSLWDQELPFLQAFSMCNCVCQQSHELQSGLWEWLGAEVEGAGRTGKRCWWGARQGDTHGVSASPCGWAGLVYFRGSFISVDDAWFADRIWAFGLILFNLARSLERFLMGSLYSLSLQLHIQRLFKLECFLSQPLKITLLPSLPSP